MHVRHESGQSTNSEGHTVTEASVEPEAASEEEAEVDATVDEDAAAASAETLVAAAFKEGVTDEVFKDDQYMYML